MKLAAAGLLFAVVLGGTACDRLTSGPPPDPEPRGAVVAQGAVDGFAWVVSAERSGDEICLHARSVGITGSTCGEAPTDHIGVLGRGGASGGPVVVQGLVGPLVDRVRIVARDGPAIVVEAVGLDSLGRDARAFAAAFAEGTRIEAIEAFGADGEVLERQLPGPP